MVEWFKDAMDEDKGEIARDSVCVCACVFRAKVTSWRVAWTDKADNT